MSKLEVLVTSVIRGQRKGPLASMLKLLLWLLSWPYRFAVFLRNKAYDWNWLLTRKAPIPVISIGNISAGGTGKTPITQWIAKQLMAHRKVAISSRGYKSKAEAQDQVLVLDPQHPAPPQVCGDEALLHQQELPAAIVVSGADRLLAAETAAAHGAEVILVDDGFQRRSLHRSLDIVVIDASDPWGHGHLLPRGFLREPLSALCRADLLILSKVTDSGAAQRIKDELRSYSQAPIVMTRLRASGVTFHDGHKAPSLQGHNVAMLCGIGNPQAFRQTIGELGGQIVLERLLADHESLSLSELQRFATLAQSHGADFIVCTEKDYIKLTVSDLPLRLAWISTVVEALGDLRALDEALRPFRA